MLIFEGDEIPGSVSLGAFHISTQLIRSGMAEKHRDVASAIEQLVVGLVGAKCTEIVKQFEEMTSELRKPAKSPEHAQELRGYFKDVEAQTAALQPLINELPAYYDFLDEFFFELSDYDDLLRWNAFKGKGFNTKDDGVYNKTNGFAATTDGFCTENHDFCAEIDELLYLKGPIMMEEQIDLATVTCVEAENAFQGDELILGMCSNR